MWYVIQVMGGQEEKTAGMIRSRVSEDAMEECFIPKKERVKKFKGSWRQVEEILFPGYVFAQAKEPEALYRELKQITMMTKLLQDGTFCFLPLSEAEEMMIKRIGNNYHVTGLSKVRVENRNKSGEKCDQKVVIIDGPLKDQEGRIVKYNLHKREVTVRISFMGNTMDLKLGLELVSVMN